MDETCKIDTVIFYIKIDACLQTLNPNRKLNIEFYFFFFFFFFVSKTRCNDKEILTTGIYVMETRKNSLCRLNIPSNPIQDDHDVLFSFVRDSTCKEQLVKAKGSRYWNTEENARKLSHRTKVTDNAGVVTTRLCRRKSWIRKRNIEAARLAIESDKTMPRWFRPFLFHRYAPFFLVAFSG